MKKRLYRGPGSTAASVDFFQNAVNFPVREEENFEDDGAYMEDDSLDIPIDQE